NGGDGVDKTIAYEYDDSGIRVSRQEDLDPKTLYLVDRQNHTGYAQTLEESGSITRAYLIAHSVLGQQNVAPVAAYLNFLTDGGGSTRGILDATGQIAAGEVYAYNAYGVRLDGHYAATDFLYRAERRDGDHDYLRARPYDFKTGRFFRVDDYAGSSQDPQSFHKYLYTHADPVNGRDPSGLVTLKSLLTTVGTIAKTTAFIGGAATTALSA
ncbi:unnamed protein product, partial [Ectocarpus sp. 4 AP-2014]